MPSFSLERPGHSRTQGPRHSKTRPQSRIQGRAGVSRNLRRTLHASKNCLVSQLAQLGSDTPGRRRQSSQRPGPSYRSHQLHTLCSSRGIQQWPSITLTNRRSKASHIVDFKSCALCLRAAGSLTAGCSRQSSGRLRQRQQLVLIVVRAAQVRGSSRDSLCGQQLEVSVANRDPESAHTAFTELQKAGQNGRPNAETCNGLLQCK